VKIKTTVQFPDGEHLRGTNGLFYLLIRYAYPKFTGEAKRDAMADGYYSDASACIEAKYEVKFLTRTEEKAYRKWNIVRILCNVIGWPLAIIGGLTLLIELDLLH